MIVEKLSGKKNIVTPSEGQVLQPVGRFGHTFTRFEGTNKALLFGANTLPNQGIPKLIVRKPFQATPVPVDSSVFLYLKDTNLWIVPVTEGDPFPTPRAWHAVASFIDKNKNESTIILSGGLKLDHKKDAWKGKQLSELYVFSLAQDHSKLKCEKKTFNFGSDIFISDHSMMITADKKVLVYGGMISRTAETNSEPSSHLFVFKYDSLQVKKIKLSTDFVNAGANVLLLPDSSILSPGGLSKRNFVFTNKPMNPDKCFH